MAKRITNPFSSTSTQLPAMWSKQLAISRPHPCLTPRCFCGTNIMGKMPWFGVAIDGLDDANSTRKYFPIDFCTDTKPVFYPINFCTEHYSLDEGSVVMMRYKYLYCNLTGNRYYSILSILYKYFSCSAFLDIRLQRYLLHRKAY